MALKLGWRKNPTYTFLDPGNLGTSIAIQIKLDDTKPNMVDTKMMGRIRKNINIVYSNVIEI